MKNILVIIVSIVVLFWSGISLYAQGQNSEKSIINERQTFTYKIVVTDSQGQPIVWAVIIVEGTMNGAVTDLNGKATITAPKGTVIKISCIGYRTCTVVLGDAPIIYVVLYEDSEPII